MEHGSSGWWHKYYKRLLERTGKINCSFCPYNRNENAKRKAKPDKHKNINRKSIRKE